MDLFEEHCRGSTESRKERHDSQRGGYDRIRKWFDRLQRLETITVAMQAATVTGLYENLRYIWQSGFREVYINVMENYGVLNN